MSTNHAGGWLHKTAGERAVISAKISAAQAGRKFTPEHLANIRAANSKPKTLEHRLKISLGRKGIASWNKGLEGSVPGFSSDPVVEAARRLKISEGQKKADHWWCRGENNWHWKGEETTGYPPEFFTLRPVILERDKHKCIQCGKGPEKARIVVHHIDHDKLNNAPKNLVTLCHEDNVRAEGRKRKILWEKKFSIYAEKMCRG